MKRLFYIIASVALLAWGCDKGLAPVEDSFTIDTGIQGTILFENWPQPDSLKDIRIVAFRNFPPNDIFIELLTGQAFAYPAISDSARIPFFVDRFEFEFEVPAGQYGYLAVAQQYGDNVLTDWRAVGQFDVDEDSLPSPITIQQNAVTRNIVIGVDFDNLPIQPF